MKFYLIHECYVNFKITMSEKSLVKRYFPHMDFDTHKFDSMALSGKELFEALTKNSVLKSPQIEMIKEKLESKKKYLVIQVYIFYLSFIVYGLKSDFGLLMYIHEISELYEKMEQYFRKHEPFTYRFVNEMEMKELSEIQENIIDDFFTLHMTIYGRNPYSRFH